MNKLQLFAEAVSGKKIVYMYRMLADASKMDAEHLAFTTENSISISRDADTTETKDGPIRTPGAVEIEATTTALLAKGDVMLNKLKFGKSIWKNREKKAKSTRQNITGHM